jgi:L-ectoine synthase
VTTVRYLLKADGMGYSMSESWVGPGHDAELCYKNHLEACYCIEGEATLVDLATGEIHEIGPGTVYALDKHDRHRMVIKTPMRVVSVFNPPLVGTENHDADGSYPLVE